MNVFNNITFSKQPVLIYIDIFFGSSASTFPLGVTNNQQTPPAQFFLVKRNHQLKGCFNTPLEHTPGNPPKPIMKEIPL